DRSGRRPVRRRGPLRGGLDRPGARDGPGRGGRRAGRRARALPAGPPPRPALRHRKGRRMTPPLVRHRLVVLLAATALLVAGAALAVHRAAGRAAERDRTHAGQPAVTKGEVRLGDGRRRLIFRNLVWGPQRDHLATVPLAAPGARRTAAPRDCL